MVSRVLFLTCLMSLMVQSKYLHSNVCYYANVLCRNFMKEKKISDEEIALQVGDFFKAIPKFE